MKNLLLIYLLIINIITFCLWGRDKRKANTQGRRISEKQLLRCVILGGGAGALAGQHLFRHKTIKGKFVWKIYVAIIIWMIALFFAVYTSSVSSS